MDHVVYLDYVAKEAEPIKIDKSDYGNMEDWLPVNKMKKLESNKKLKRTTTKKY